MEWFDRRMISLVIEGSTCWDSKFCIVVDNRASSAR